MLNFACKLKCQRCKFCRHHLSIKTSELISQRRANVKGRNQ
ncbi:hypothetical protein MED222_06320 [Vibrio sp. MED222]|nr:hypothetical protein MED222_06320 [Vibrio sp. MED222]